MKETDKFILYHGSKSGIKGEIPAFKQKTLRLWIRFLYGNGTRAASYTDL